MQLKCQYLLRYLIVSLLLSGGFDGIQETILPVIQLEKSKYSDVYTRFIETLYEQFDFDGAIALIKELGEAAQDDLLLKNFVDEIKTHAALLVYHVKAKLYKTVSVKNLAQEAGFKTEEEARTRLEENLKKEGN